MIAACLVALVLSVVAIAVSAAARSNQAPEWLAATLSVLAMASAVVVLLLAVCGA